MELFAGTEPSMMGTETWTRKGMYFFPDNAFYEFITEEDMLKNYEDPSYIPPTYLMDEVRPGEKYELVFTILKGGAFARYRCGDIYRCVGLENREDETRIPRFEYIDRVPWIIDIARVYTNFGKWDQKCNWTFKASNYKLGGNEGI